MSEIAAIFLVAGTSFTFLACVVAMMGPCWPLWQTGPLERKRPDYRHINEVELDLGLPLSDYRAQGVDAIGMLEERSTDVVSGNQRVIEKLDDQLDPVQALRKQVSTAFAVPPHMLLEGCPACGHGLRDRRDPAQPCSFCGWRMPSTMINAMDEPYPVEVILHKQEDPPEAGLDLRSVVMEATRTTASR